MSNTVPNAALCIVYSIAHYTGTGNWTVFTDQVHSSTHSFLLSTDKVKNVYLQISLSLLFFVLLLRLISNRLISLDRSLNKNKKKKKHNSVISTSLSNLLVKTVNQIIQYHIQKRCVYSLEDELLREDWVLAISWVSPGYMHAVQVDVAVWVCKMFDGKFVGLFYIKH